MSLIPQPLYQRGQKVVHHTKMNVKVSCSYCTSGKIKNKHGVTKRCPFCSGTEQTWTKQSVPRVGTISGRTYIDRQHVKCGWRYHVNIKVPSTTPGAMATTNVVIHEPDIELFHESSDRDPHNSGSDC